MFLENKLDDDASLNTDEKNRLLSLCIVYDKRQKALKVGANSVYGFLGAGDTGPYSCREAAETTTFIGRQMLDESSTVASVFSRTLHRDSDNNNVGAYDLVYGDTDSLMFTLSNVLSAQDAVGAGEKIANHITSIFHSRGHTSKQLEFEKAYWPYILFGKKKYAGVLWNRKRDGSVVSRGIKFSGTANGRRDSCKFVHHIYDAMIAPLLELATNVDTTCISTSNANSNPAESGSAACLIEFHKYMTCLVKGSVQLDDLIITKGVRDEYKTTGLKWKCVGSEVPEGYKTNREDIGKLLLKKQNAVLRIGTSLNQSTVHEFTRAELKKMQSQTALGAIATSKPFSKFSSPPIADNSFFTTDYALVEDLVFVPDDGSLAHMCVVQKQKEREPGNETKAGDRVQLVYVRGKSGAKARDIAEDVEHVRQHGLKPNIPYYIDHQIRTPVTTILELIHPDPNKLLSYYILESSHISGFQSKLDTFAFQGATGPQTKKAKGMSDSSVAKRAKVASKSGSLDSWMIKPKVL